MTVGSSFRYVGVAGILSAVLITAGGIALNVQIPDLSSSATKFAGAVISNRGALRTGGLLFFVAMIPLIVFAGGIIDVLSSDVPLSRVLRRAAFAFATATVAMFAVYYGVIGAIVATAESSAPETVRMVYGVAEQVVTVGSLFLGLLVLTTSVLSLVAHKLPRWVRWLGVVGGLCLAISSFALVTADSLGPFYLIGWYLSQAWFIVAGVSILIGRFSGQPEQAVKLSGTKATAEPAGRVVDGAPIS